MAEKDEDILDTLNRWFYQNVSNPVVGTAVDTAVGVGDLIQLLLKEGASRLGVETKPYTPVAPRTKQAMGVSDYDPYSPVAMATNVVGGAPRAGLNLLRSAVTKTPALFDAGIGALAREGQLYAASEGGAEIARQVAPDSVGAELLGSMLGGTAFNTADVLRGGKSTAGAPASYAVKPKGGVFLPQTIEDSTLNRYLRRLEEGLGELDLDAFDGRRVADQARKYFTTTYGTVDDPLRKAMLEGRLNDPDARDYLLKAAREDYASRGAASRRPAREAEAGVSNAMEDFEEYYDSKTGVRADLVGPNGWEAARRAEQDKLVGPMEASGVPEDLINPPFINIQTKDDLKKTFDDVQERQLSQSGTNRFEDYRASKLAAMLGMDPSQQTIATAVERGDLIYDFDPRHSFLKRDSILRGAEGIPADKLGKMSFPELVVAANKNNARYGDLDAAVERTTNGRAIPPKMWLKEGVKPVTAVGDSQWVRIVDPEYTKLESAHMGHSVRGYAKKGAYGAGTGGADAIRDGSAQVYSLRDSKTGLPRITVEVDASDRPAVKQIKGKQNQPPNREDWESVFALFDKLGFDEDTYIGELLLDDKGFGYTRWSDLYRQHLDNKKGGMARGGPVEIDDKNNKTTGGMINAPTETPANYSKGRWRLI